MKDDEPDVLEMLARHELALKQLYDLFAAQFAHRQDFWQGLARDEQRHADALGTLRSDPAAIAWLAKDSGLKPQAIKSSIGYVESQIARARGGTLNPLQALAIARDLESALIEKQFSRLSGSAPAEIRKVVTVLATETERHHKGIVDAIHAEKR